MAIFPHSAQAASIEKLDRTTHWVDTNYIAAAGQDLFVTPTAPLTISLPKVADAIAADIAEKYITIIDPLNQFEVNPPLLQADGTEEIRGTGITTPESTLQLDGGADWSDREIRVEPNVDHWVVVIEGRGLKEINPVSFTATVTDTLDAGISDKAIAPDTFTGAVNQLVTAQSIWVDSTAGMVAADRQRITIQAGHIINLDETANSIDFAPANGNWDTLTGSWNSPTWDIGRGQNPPATAEIVTLIAQPADTNWLITFGGTSDILVSEEWITVGSPGAPAFQNGWINFGSDWQVARFRKEGDEVHVQGLVKEGIYGFDSTGNIFTLPVGFRPALSVMKAAISNTTVGRLDIRSTGEVRAAVGVTRGYVSLEFTFPLG